MKKHLGTVVDLVLLGLRGQVTTVITARRSAAFLDHLTVRADFMTDSKWTPAGVNSLLPMPLTGLVTLMCSHIVPANRTIWNEIFKDLCNCLDRLCCFVKFYCSINWFIGQCWVLYFDNVHCTLSWIHFKYSSSVILFSYKTKNPRVLILGSFEVWVCCLNYTLSPRTLLLSDSLPLFSIVDHKAAQVPRPSVCRWFE